MLDAVLHLKVEGPPERVILLEGLLRSALEDVLSGNQDDYPILKQVVVETVRVLAPGETWQIAPAAEEADEPAAAGEVPSNDHWYRPLKGG